MFIKNRDCAIATAAGLTTASWYVLGNIAVALLNQIITKAWIAPHLSHVFLMLQPPFASFTGMTQEGFSFLYFIIGLIQVFVVTALVVWVAAKIYHMIHDRR
jgi:hypothetical protein